MGKEREQLKKPYGRQIAGIKQRAREALPSGTPEQLAEKANAIAREEGFDYQFKPEKMAARLRSASPSRQRAEPEGDAAEPTLSELLKVREAIDKVEGGLPVVIDLFAKLDVLLDTLGTSLPRTRACVQALAKLTGERKPEA
jgi:hypothetical protein